MSLLVASCQALPTGDDGPLVRPVPSKRPRVTASKSPSPAPSASPSASASSSPAASPSATLKPFFARVVGPDGQPVAGLTVRGTSETQKTPLTATTASDGTFELKSPDGRPLNLEAEVDAYNKGLLWNVPPTAAGLTLTIAATGGVAGQVAAPGATTLEKVEVRLLGTAYTGLTDAEGRFVLQGVPAGVFTLEAARTDLGTATVRDVLVQSKTLTQAGTLTLTQAP